MSKFYWNINQVDYGENVYRVERLKNAAEIAARYYSDEEIPKSLHDTEDKAIKLQSFLQHHESMQRREWFECECCTPGSEPTVFVGIGINDAVIISDECFVGFKRRATSQATLELLMWILTNPGEYDTSADDPTEIFWALCKGN